MRGKSATALRTSSSAACSRRSSSRACACVARPVDLHHLPGFGLCHRAVDADRAASPRASRRTRQHRVHDEVHGDVHLAEHDADRIDQERHVGRHHAHQRAMRGGRRCWRSSGGAMSTSTPVALARGGRIPGARAPRRRDPPGDARAGLLRRRRGRRRAGIPRVSARRARGTRCEAAATIFSMSARRAAGILPSIGDSRGRVREARRDQARDYTWRADRAQLIARARGPSSTARPSKTRAESGRAWRGRASTAAPPAGARIRAPWARPARTRAAPAGVSARCVRRRSAGAVVRRSRPAASSVATARLTATLSMAVRAVTSAAESPGFAARTAMTRHSGIDSPKWAK